LEFAPEIERLSLLLGRDLTHWSRGRPLTDEQFADRVLPGVSGAKNSIQKIHTQATKGQGINSELSLPRP
jgi:hypothetical protein